MATSMTAAIDVITIGSVLVKDITFVVSRFFPCFGLVPERVP